MVAQANSQAAKVLEVADDPRLSREVKAFLKALIAEVPATRSLFVQAAAELKKHLQ